MLAKGYGRVYEDLMPIAEQMVSNVNDLPSAMKKWAGHLNRLGAISQYVYYVALVKHYLSNRSAKILDWGAQYGHVSRLLRHYFDNVHCYDPLDDEQYIVRNGYDPYCDDFKGLFEIPEDCRFYGTGDASVINRPSHLYDAVIGSGVLEHVPEDYGGCSESVVLREIYRILKPGGLFFIWNLPSRLGSVELLNTALGRKVHNFSYSKAQIVQLLTEAGFEVVALDSHEFLNMMSRDYLGRLIGHDKAWELDYIVSKIPPVSIFAQHFTIVTRKPL
jgi:SAM-dependent methyltransferase